MDSRRLEDAPYKTLVAGVGHRQGYLDSRPRIGLGEGLGTGLVADRSRPVDSSVHQGHRGRMDCAVHNCVAIQYAVLHIGSVWSWRGHSGRSWRDRCSLECNYQCFVAVMDRSGDVADRRIHTEMNLVDRVVDMSLAGLDRNIRYHQNRVPPKSSQSCWSGSIVASI